MIKLSGYKILKKIGSGGMGEVYLAEHEKLEKKVAIKSLHKNLATNKDFRARFLKEAKTHSMLNHANIVGLLDYKERKDGLFLIMEYVDGMQLDKHIKNVSGPIPQQNLVPLFIQILDAVGYAHKKGLIHRDIKPSNIMISKDGVVKVLDFGIAKLQDDDKELTKTGVQIGTASYMSPEQVNAKKLDKLTDIYSLGVTLYYMAVGKSPYSEDTNTFSIQTKIVGEDLPVPSEIYPGAKFFEPVISKATQKDKKERYQSCDEFKSVFSTTKKSINSGVNSSSRYKGLFYILLILCIIASLFLYRSIEEAQNYKDQTISLESDLRKKQDLLQKSYESINDLKKELEEDKKKVRSGVYNTKCYSSKELNYQQKSSTNFLLYVSYKLEDGSWSDWKYWQIDQGYNELRYMTTSGVRIKTKDFKYYITYPSGTKRLFSRDKPRFTSVCSTPTIYVY